MNKKDLSVFDTVSHYIFKYNDVDEIVDKEFVKNLRKKLNMTQSAFAVALGVTKKTIEKWEQGKNPVKGCSARLLYALNDDLELIKKFYSLEFVEGSKSYNEEISVSDVKDQLANDEQIISLSQKEKEYKINGVSLIKNEN